MAKNSKANGEVENVGYTQETTILELAQKIKETIKGQSNIEFYPLPEDDPRDAFQTQPSLKG